MITGLSVALAGCGQADSVEQYGLPEQFVASAEQEPPDFMGMALRIIDGESIDVLNDAAETIRIRLNGIDCPERG